MLNLQQTTNTIQDDGTKYTLNSENRNAATLKSQKHLSHVCLKSNRTTREED